MCVYSVLMCSLFSLCLFEWGAPSFQIITGRLILSYEFPVSAWLVSSQLFLSHPVYLLPLGLYLSLFYISFFSSYFVVCFVARCLTLYVLLSSFS